MTLLVIFADGHGQLRIQATRAPQIRRREISRQTGWAEIVFCAVPGVSPTRLVKQLTEAIGASRLSVNDRGAVVRLAAYEIHIKPMIAQNIERGLRFIRRWTGLIAVRRWRRLERLSEAASGGGHE